MATILQSQSLELVAIMIAINVMIGGFSGDDLKWLAHVTVRLQVSDSSQLPDYTVRLQVSDSSQLSDYPVWLQLCR